MNNIIIFRTGSIGDTLITLPLFRYIRKNYSDSKIILLTNKINNSISQSIPSNEILSDLKLVDEVILYDFSAGKVRSAINLIRTLKKYLPYSVFYLSPEKKILKKIQDYIFFTLFGAQKIYGMNLLNPKRNKFDPSTGLYEPEYSRLIRSVGINYSPIYQDFQYLPDPSDIDFYKIKFNVPIDLMKIITISIGTRCNINNWGNDNWEELCRELYKFYPDYCLIAIGGLDERVSSDHVMKGWPSERKFNFCGSLTLRDSACILKNSNLFIGHNSGPMHLAAAAGVNVVSLFSNRDLPGTWYPYGNLDGVIQAKKGKSIKSIGVEEVMKKILSILEKSC